MPGQTRTPTAGGTFHESSPWDGAWLLQRVAAQDAEALAQLYRMWGDRLYSMALQLLGDEGAAAEALQDCFLRVWHKAGAYDAGKSRGFTWVGMILRGICLDMLRKRARRAPSCGAGGQAALLEIPDDGGGMEDLLFRETVLRVKAALEHLTEDEAESVRRALFDPATVEHHAKRWGVPVGTAKTRIFRAMVKLRHLLGHLKGGLR
jgi:RNA polymerase sigma-70 factor (ECF subfamily)